MQVVLRRTELHAKRMPFTRDALVSVGERCELSFDAIELRVERLEIENRTVDALRKRRVLTPQRGGVLISGLRRRCATRCADDAADRAAAGDDEKAGLESGMRPHERETVPQGAEIGVFVMLASMKLCALFGLFSACSRPRRLLPSS